MPKNWSSLADSNQDASEADFKAAFYQLLSSQVLYSSDRSQSVSYALINRYRTEFREAADLSGQRLEFNDDYRYCYLIPQEAKPQPMDLQDTLFVLVLRRMYHERAVSGNLRLGEATVSLVDFTAVYNTSTGKTYSSSATEMREMLKRMKRYGIAKIGEKEAGDIQPFTITILPAIADLINENIINKLDSHKLGQGKQSDAIDDETQNEHIEIEEVNP